MVFAQGILVPNKTTIYFIVIFECPTNFHNTHILTRKQNKEEREKEKSFVNAPPSSKSAGGRSERQREERGTENLMKKCGFSCRHFFLFPRPWSSDCVASRSLNGFFLLVDIVIITHRQILMPTSVVDVWFFFFFCQVVRCFTYVLFLSLFPGRREERRRGQKGGKVSQEPSPFPCASEQEEEEEEIAMKTSVLLRTTCATCTNRKQTDTRALSPQVKEKRPSTSPPPPPKKCALSLFSFVNWSP